MGKKIQEQQRINRCNIKIQSPSGKRKERKRNRRLARVNRG